mmetsp:Transcript_27936/g.70666  ORF Transcript_27936/g.70666 Transcript_27936/m.70666 type:complete len:83 (-) Transcript_27936:673-921(-)
MEWRNSTDGEGKGKLFFAVNGEMDNCDGNKNAECELDASEKKRPLQKRSACFRWRHQRLSRHQDSFPGGGHERRKKKKRGVV